MSVLAKATEKAQAESNIHSVIIHGIRTRIAAEFWTWFRQNREDVIVRKRVLFVVVAIRVKDLEWLFEQLFGPDPLASELADFR